MLSGGRCPGTHKHISAALIPAASTRADLFDELTARHALLRELVEITLPALGLLVAERVQVVPGEDAGVVHVVEGDANGIVADRVDLRDGDVALARHRHALLRRM